jgi:hypothetical protein
VRTAKALVLVAAVSSALLTGAPVGAGGGGSPVDPAAARREITRAFEAFGALSTVEEVEANLDLIDDPRGVVEAAREALRNFPYEVSHDVNRVTDVQFPSATEAEVTYDIVIDRGPNFLGRTGYAVFQDGKWRLTRETVCGNLALAGATCALISHGEPEDPAAAKEAIIDTWEAAAALTDAENVAANLHLIDDPRGVVDAARQAYENFPYEVTHDTNRVTDVFFTSPTDAFVTWDILIEGGPNFLGRTGFAVFKDGRWKMTRATACESLALAGGWCDGPPSGDGPPPRLLRPSEPPAPAPSSPPARPAGPAPAMKAAPRFTG